MHMDNPFPIFFSAVMFRQLGPTGSTDHHSVAGTWQACFINNQLGNYPKKQSVTNNEVWYQHQC